MLYPAELYRTNVPVPHHFEGFAFGGDLRMKLDCQSSVLDGLADEKAAACHPQILLIGDDPTLQYSRGKILESAGYAVRCVNSNVVVEELFLRGIELVVLCHTIGDERMRRILAAFTRLVPQVPLLLVAPLGSVVAAGEKPAAVPAHPAALLGAVAAVLAGQRGDGAGDRLPQQAA
jgi:hypothetical protein